MAKKISRRSFIKQTTTIGVGSLVAGNIITDIGMAAPKGKVDISVVQGEDYFKNTIKAVEQLGGIGKFVPKNSKVAILANPQRNNPGAYSNPEVLKAAIQLCKKAGVKEVSCVSLLPEGKCWVPTGLKKVVDEEKIKLVVIDRKNENLFKIIPIPKGKSLKEAHIMKEFFNYDVFIDLPICKDHAGNKFTGTLKNLMGLNSQKSNRTFHKPNWTTDIDDIKHLDQCIADLNTIIRPDLCIVDATEFITTNGPFGPGKLLKPQKVVAGTDRVAIDSYCCTLWGLKPGDIFTIVASHEHKLGKMNLSKLKIKELKI
jgi:uncharacterized protein (DUF362 family)